MGFFFTDKKLGHWMYEWRVEVISQVIVVDMSLFSLLKFSFGLLLNGNYFYSIPTSSTLVQF